MGFKLGVRYIKKYKVRSFIIFLSFLLSIIIICTNGILSQTANRITLEEELSRNRSQINVHDVNENVISYLKENPSIENLKIEKLLDASDEFSEYRINLIGLDNMKIKRSSGDNSIDSVEKSASNLIVSGALPTNKDEVVLQKWALNTLQKNVGDTIEFKSYFTSKDVKKKIVGFVEDSKRDKESGVFELYTVASEKYISKYNTVGIEVKDNKKMLENVEDISSTLKKDFRVSEKNININKSLLEAYENDGDTSIELIKIMISSVLFASLIVFSTYMVSMRKRIEDFGIFRALGIMKKDIIYIIVCEILTVFFAALVIGVGISLYIAKKINLSGKNIYSELTINSSNYTASVFPYKVILITGALMMIVVLLIGVFTYLQSVRGNVVDTINTKRKLSLTSRGFSRRKLKVKNNFFKDKLKLETNISAFLSLRFIKSDFLIIALMIISMSFVTSEIIMGSYYNKQNEKIMELDDNFSKGDITIRQNNPFNIDSELEEKDIKKMNGINGIKKGLWSASRSSTIEIPKNKMKKKAYFDEQNKNPYYKELVKGVYKEKENSYIIKNTVYGYNDDAMLELNNHLLEGKINTQRLKNGESCVLYYPIYYMNLKKKTDDRNMLLGYKPGDYIEVEIPIELKNTPQDSEKILKYWRLQEIPKTVKKTYKIDAIVDYLPIKSSYGIENSSNIILAYDELSKVSKDIKYSFGDIYMEKNITSSREISDDIINILPQHGGFTVSNMYKERVEHDLNKNEYLSFENIKYFLFILVCIACLINILNYKVIEKKADIGVMRALGMTEGDLRAMFLFEGLLYGLSSTILSWSITIIRQFSYIRKLTLENHITGMDLSVSVGIYFTILILNLLICVLAIYIPGKKILEENVMSSIRNIE